MALFNKYLKLLKERSEKKSNCCKTCFARKKYSERRKHHSTKSNGGGGVPGNSQKQSPRPLPTWPAHSDPRRQGQGLRGKPAGLPQHPVHKDPQKRTSPGCPRHHTTCWGSGCPATSCALPDFMALQSLPAAQGMDPQELLSGSEGCGSAKLK